MKTQTKVLAGVVTAFPVVILTAAIACTAAIASGASMRWRVLFRLICHGIPSRCFVLWSVPMPICARCTAIYGGLITGVALFLILPKIREIVAGRMMLVAAFFMAVDGLTQAFKLRESTNFLRTETGLACGITFAIWVLSSLET